MAYCTQSEILEQMDEDVLIQLTDDDDAGVVDTGVVAQKIADADALIDGYCGAKYTVPFDPVPALVLSFSVTIAIYKLYGRRKGAPKDIRTRYEDVIEFLKGVAKGENIISTVEDAGGPEATTVKSDRIFSIGRNSDSSVGSLDNY